MVNLLRQSRLSIPWAVTAIALAMISVAEYVDSSETPKEVAALHIAAALVVTGSVGLIARRSQIALVLGCGAVLVESTFQVPAELFGNGVALVLLSYGAAHWLSRRQLAWSLGLVVVTVVVRAARAPGLNFVDGAFDLVIIALAVLVGMELRRRAARADALELDLAGTEARVADAVEAERARLARELHDIVASSVSVIVVQAGTSRPLAEKHSAELAEVLRLIETSGREALLELRRLLGVLRGEPVSLTEPIPGRDDLDRLVERMRQAGMDVSLDAGSVPTTSKGIELCVFRVVQEGLTNALRHAPGGSVAVTVRPSATSVEVAVVDGGALHPVSHNDGSGLGLVGLRERIAVFGGALDAGPYGNGFRLAATLPLADLGMGVR